MTETIRQVLLGLASAAVFAGFFWGLQLAWWLSLLAAAGVFGGLMLIVPRVLDATEIQVADGVTKAELDAATSACREAAARLQAYAAEEQLAEDIAGSLRRLGLIVAAIGAEFAENPRDLRHARGFAEYHLQSLLDIVETFMRLSRISLTEATAHRLAESGERIMAYEPNFQAVYDACLAADFQKLEVSTTALAQILQLEAPASEGR